MRQILQQATSPKSASLSWVLKNKEKVQQLCVEVMSTTHAEFEVEATGLYVYPKYLYLGASPDGLVTCACCGNGLLEVKCPCSVYHSPPTCAVYLYTSENKGYTLSRDREYYFQIQGQMGITERPYCDFICWTLVGAHQEIVFPKDEHKALLLCFSNFPCVLSGPKERNAHPSEATGIYCYCHKGEVANMVLCDSPSCKYGWYHFLCVNLTAAPASACMVLYRLKTVNMILYIYNFT